ncbi:hypothetical protein HMPREF0578_0014 [Mobiluncus mulieris 28-1]|uniref:helix-turn-helix domain-containing protein n=1 Tax=Mobiluncus mulieris TaxID=2052 RepID=UPI0001BE802C|nr:helix-turn-helix transcriptional regulator [Mobiluncus mulieris]EEZ90110.1 hypothetical protein HMPREF0578_0014 [Mobiluncus mulieris 28-1]
MVARSENSEVLKEVGQILYRHRRDLTDYPSSRMAFIEEATKLGLLEPGWISEKSLANLENGNNLPSIETLCRLALALQIDRTQLFDEVAVTLGY